MLATRWLQRAVERRLFFSSHRVTDTARRIFQAPGISLSQTSDLWPLTRKQEGVTTGGTSNPALPSSSDNHASLVTMSVSLLLTWKQEMIRVQNILPICFLFHHSERVRVFWLTALFLILLYLYRSHGDTVSKQCIFPYLSALMYLTHFCTKNSILYRRSIWNTPHEIKIQK